MGALSPTHWLIIVGVLVVLFGAKRLPDAARSLGRSARILKAEVKDINPDPDPDAEPSSVPARPAPLPPAPPSAAAPSTTASTRPDAGPLTDANGTDATSTAHGQHPSR